MASYTIRSLVPTDNSIVAGIIRQSLKEHNADKPGTVYYDPTTDDLYSLFNIEKALYVVLEVDGIVVGGAGIYPTDGLPEGYCELVKIYLKQEYRGKGYGKLLIRKCIDIAREFGFTNVYLETMPELNAAVKLYKQCGFVNIHEPLGQSGHYGCDIWMTLKIE